MTLLAESHKESCVMLLTKLAELSVGDDKLAESSQTLSSLVSILLSSVSVHWCAWYTSVSAIDVLCLPCKVLEKVALVLGEKEHLGLLDHIAEVVNQLLTLRGKLLGWAGHELLVDEGVEGDINLLVARDLAALKSCDANVSKVTSR